MFADAGEEFVAADAGQVDRLATREGHGGGAYGSRAVESVAFYHHGVGAAQRVDRAPEAVEVDGHVVLDIQPVELAQGAHERVVAAVLVVPGEQV